LTDRERQGINIYLLTLTPEALNELQIKARPLSFTLDRKQRFDLNVSDYGMVFQHAAAKQEHEVQLNGKSGPKKARFQILVPPNDTSYTLTVDTLKGFVSKDQTLALKFKFECTDPTRSLVDVVVEMIVQGGFRHFFVIKVTFCSRKKSRRFDHPQNVTIDTKKLQKDTIFHNHTYSIPKPLVRLRSMLIHAKGLETVDIFRTVGATWEVQSLKTHVKKGTYYVCADPHAVATCLKLYLRSIPPIFDKVPQESISSLERLEDLGRFKLDEDEVDLASWVIDLMALVVLSPATGMSARAMGIL
jgi:RhoGAP domain